MQLRGAGVISFEKVSKLNSHRSHCLKIDGADWLIFPDRHLLLWRYEWFRGLLKWTPDDFGEKASAPTIG